MNNGYHFVLLHPSRGTIINLMLLTNEVWRELLSCFCVDLTLRLIMAYCLYRHPSDGHSLDTLNSVYILMSRVSHVTVFLYVFWIFFCISDISQGCCKSCSSHPFLYRYLKCLRNCMSVDGFWRNLVNIALIVRTFSLVLLCFFHCNLFRNRIS